MFKISLMREHRKEKETVLAKRGPRLILRRNVFLLANKSFVKIHEDCKRDDDKVLSVFRPV